MYAGTGLGTGLLFFGIVSGGRLGRRRLLFLLAALLITSGMLASCGSSGGGGSPVATVDMGSDEFAGGGGSPSFPGMPVDPGTWDLHITAGSPATWWPC